MRAFDDPRLDAPTPLTINGDLVYGHVADWAGTHIGRSGVKPPRNHSGYRYFHLGAYDHDGVEIDVGKITMDTTHEHNLRASAEAAQQHYDNTGSVAAYIRVGEDAHGIWFSGKLAKRLDEGAIEVLRGASVSGDWRPINGRAEMIGVLACNIAGFPIPRSHALLAAGHSEALALVACGIVPRDAAADARLRLRARVARDRLVRRLR